MAWRQELISDRNHRLLFATEDVPAMMTLEEELFAAEEQHWGLPALQDQDSSSALHPAEPQPTELELKQWKARLDHFHRAAGHPTSRNLARLVKDSGSPAWKAQAAREAWQQITWSGASSSDPLTLQGMGGNRLRHG